MTSLPPPDLSWTRDGAPYSERYKDVYCSADGPEQAARVYLAGNGLPSRFELGRPFTILETGFGLGLNFLATWRAWRAIGVRCPLRYVSIEKHPFTADDLAAALERMGQLDRYGRALVEALPDTTPGSKRLELDSDGLVLDLLYGDVREILPQLDLFADALLLDGFSPATNPEMWSSAVFTQLARLSRPGTTFATYSVAQNVRLELTACGFGVEKRPGFGSKRFMLAGELVEQRGG